MPKPKISAKAILNDIRSGMTNADLISKYNFTEKSLQYLLRRLTESGLLTSLELYERTTLSPQLEEAGSTVLTCHNCGGLLPDGANTCPYCEILERNFTGTLILDAADLPPDRGYMGSALKLDSELIPDVTTGVDIKSDMNGTWEIESVPPESAAGRPVEKPGESQEVSIFLKAASRGRLDVVEKLLAKGVDVDCRSKYLNTPLMRSAFKGHLDVTQFLLDRGADVNAANTHGNTALILSAGADNPDMVTLLMLRGADPQAKNTDGNTALIVAANENKTDIAQVLIAHGAEVDGANNEGDTPLTRACDKGFSELAALLLDGGADPNRATRLGNTALMKACFRGHMDVVKLLLKAGAEVNAVNSFGNTALMKAAFKGRSLVARRLLEEGADPSVTDNMGNTALMRAANGGHQDIVELLSHFLGLMAPAQTSEGE